MRDKRDKIIGVMGITRRDENRMRQHDVREVTAELAHAAVNSKSLLHRKLRIALDISLYEFLDRSLIQSAAEALAKTMLPIIQISFDHSFCDQSAFTEQYRKRTAMTPKNFRRRRQG